MFFTSLKSIKSIITALTTPVSDWPYLARLGFINTISLPRYGCIPVLLGCLFLVTSCTFAYKEEGAIDYRKSDVSTEDLGKFSDDLNDNEITNQQGEPIRIAKLQRKNLSQDNNETTFSENDNICIRLTSAFIKDYSEGPLSIASDAIQGQIRSRGEIAVVVNAFPVKDTVSFDFSDKGVNQGKVVFFSDDIVAGQFMNFNNMPIYGPSSEGKNGIGLEIWIMELDISDVLTGNLLRDLASFGTIPLPFSSAGNMILESMGKSLLNSTNTHDTNFLYRVLLEPKKGGLLPNASLEVGHYVFIRVEEGYREIPKNLLTLDYKKLMYGGRIRDINWSELVLDENTGRIYKKVKTSGNKYDYIEFTDLNYLVITIDKDTSGRDLSVENKLYEAFLSSMKETANSNQFVSTIVLKLKTRDIMKLFDSYFDAVQRKKSAIDAEKNETDTGSKDKKVKARKAAEAQAVLERTNLINRFKSFWSGYIKPSLEKHHTGQSAEINSFDLGKETIDQIAGQLMAKVSQGVGKGIIEDIESCADSLFTWLPDGIVSDQQTPEVKVSNIMKGIVSLIKKSKCPNSTQNTETPSADSGST